MDLWNEPGCVAVWKRCGNLCSRSIFYSGNLLFCDRIIPPFSDADLDCNSDGNRRRVSAYNRIVPASTVPGRNDRQETSNNSDFARAVPRAQCSMAAHFD